MSAAMTPPGTEAPLLPGRVENARALWVVLIIMALLAGCALLFARGAMRLSGDWQTQLGGTLTVQVLLENVDDWDADMDAAQAVLTAELPGADIERVSRDAAAALLQPWLGNAELPDNLPVPGLLNVTSDRTLSPAPVQAALDAAGLSANVDDNSRYADQLRGTARRLVGVSGGVLALILAAGLAVNIFATRAGMNAQRDIIRVLVQVGATDGFIAKLFVGQAGWRGAVGAAIGLGLAAVIWLLLSVGGDWGGLGWTGFGAGLIDFIWLLGLGGLFAVICALAAGVTAKRQLAFERKRL